MYPMYRYEFYHDHDAEPDSFVVINDNTDDCETALATYLRVPDIRLVWLLHDGDADAWDVFADDVKYGIVYVTVC